MSKLFAIVSFSIASCGIACAAVVPTITPVTAPEIDPASAVSALTMLFAGAAMLRGRIAKK